MKIRMVCRPYPPDTPQVIVDYEAELRARAEVAPGILRTVAKRYQEGNQ